MADRIIPDIITCAKCGETKSRDLFRFSRSVGYTTCKDCLNAKSRRYRKTEKCRDWIARNAERMALEQRRRMFAKRYGLTLDGYEALYEAQGGQCAICGGVSKDGRRLSVDHCHETGKVRGLLCNCCNLGIGRLGDTVDKVARAIEYLKRTGS